MSSENPDFLQACRLRTRLFFAGLPLQVTRFNQATESSAMKFGEAVVSGLRNYFNFSGRASRSEFWFFVLFCILVPIVGSVGDLFFFSTLAREGLGPIYAISNLALFVPGLRHFGAAPSRHRSNRMVVSDHAHHYRQHLVACLVVRQRAGRSQPIWPRSARHKIMVIPTGRPDRLDAQKSLAALWRASLMLARDKR